MNIFLAMIGFAVVFGMGFDGPPAVIGNVLYGSPAQKAGLEAGDRIAYLNDVYQHDFTMLAPNVALAGDDAIVKLVVQKPDGRYVNLTATPQRAPDADGKGFLQLGVGQPFDLVGPPVSPAAEELYKKTNEFRADWLALKPGEKIVSIAGTRVEVTPPTEQILAEKDNRDKYFATKRHNLEVLDKALQNSKGLPIEIIAVNDKGVERPFMVQPGFSVSSAFDSNSLSIAGMSMRSRRGYDLGQLAGLQQAIARRRDRRNHDQQHRLADGDYAHDQETESNSDQCGRERANGHAEDLTRRQDPPVGRHHAPAADQSPLRPGHCSGPGFRHDGRRRRCQGQPRPTRRASTAAW